MAAPPSQERSAVALTTSTHGWHFPAWQGHSHRCGQRLLSLRPHTRSQTCSGADDLRPLRRALQRCWAEAEREHCARTFASSNDSIIRAEARAFLDELARLKSNLVKPVGSSLGSSTSWALARERPGGTYRHDALLRVGMDRGLACA